jgi:hypothetical protein
MRRILILFSALAVLLSFGISIGAPKFVDLLQVFIGEDNPKNRIWLKVKDKNLINKNIICEYNRRPQDPRTKYAAICQIKYLTDKEREPYLLRYKREDKKFYLGNEKEPYDSGKATESAIARGEYAKYDNMEDTKRKWGVWPAIWVMDPSGRLYVSSTPQAGIFNHSSFLKGGSVICAGEIHLVDGVIRHINNVSGHYQPPDKALQNAVDQLVKDGVKLDGDMQIEEYNSSKCTRLKDRGKEAPSEAKVPSNTPYDTYIKQSDINPCN